ncbi:MAG: flagellar motor switch protein FliN [Spirochaetae bacterium HGW-Spirochaetae-1]|nr:MAG: flagellar motor switch protein FliN [Spirochaetae bacterium HGW-Spirochaetae-1]
MEDAMGDGSLSQDEIDALLQGADDIGTIPGTSPSMDFGGSSGMFSGMEQNSVRDLLNGIVGSVAPSLAGYLGGKNLVITNAVVEGKNRDAIMGEFPSRYVQVAMDYSGVVSGKNLVIFNLADAGSISSLMMGDESGVAPAEMTEAHQSTIQEFTNQLLSSIATQLGNRLGGGIGTTPAVLSMVRNAKELQLPPGDLVKITYDIIIEGVVNSKLYHIMDANLASSMSRGGGMQTQSMGPPQTYQQQASQVGISPVKFPPLDEGISQSAVGDISLLLDVPMTLTVELGRTSKLVQEILGLGEGSIIELDKLAGEPVDLLVNGKLIAKGEVVVIDENFGVRVTDIVSPDERLTGMRP